MSSIGSALVTQPHDPPITAYNWPDSQDHERTGRRSPGRAPVSCHPQPYTPSARQVGGARTLTGRPTEHREDNCNPLAP